MKKLLLKVAAILCSIILTSTIVYAQEVTYNTGTQFYYNPFDDSNLGVLNNYIAGTSNKTIVTASTTAATFNNTIALTSVPGVNSKNNIYGQIIAAADRNLNNNDFEWTFLYKNNSATSPVEPYDNSLQVGPIIAGQGAWQYWLTANTNDQSSLTVQGFYITQVGSNMIFRYRNNANDIQSLISFPITNNVVWTIKVQRLATGRWRVWANPVSTSSEAITYQGQTDQSAFNNYVYSMLATTDLRTAGNNFYWDNIKIYTRRLSFTGLNSAANGITQPSFYPNETNVALFGMQVNLRGTYAINSVNIGLTSSAGTNPNAYFTNGKIVRSIDDTFTSAGDNTTIASFAPNSFPLQSGTISGGDPYYTSGNTDGSLTRVSDYFLVVDILSSINYGNPAPYTTFVFTGPAQVTTTDYTNPPAGGYTNNAATGNNSITFSAMGPPTISYATPQSYPVGTTISPLNPTVTNSPTSYSTTGLPPGLSLSTSTGQITGNPTTISPATNYTVTATNASGSTSTTINITVTIQAPAVTYATPPTYTAGTAIVNLSPNTTGGAVSSYSISPSLPAGLSISPSTGIISGTPTVVSAATLYTVTATNAGGSVTPTLTIMVIPATPTVTLATPVPICGTSNENMTAASGYPVGGTYNWYLVASGGTSIATGTTYNPFVGGTTTFYVDYTVSGITSVRLAVPITIVPKVISSISRPVVSWAFDSGSLTDLSGNGNTGILENSPTTTTDRNGVANGAYNFNGSNTYITSTTNFNPTELIFSISMWFKTTTPGGMLAGFGGNQVSLSNATHDRQIWLTATGQLGFGIYNGGNITATTAKTYIDGLWHHVVATCGPTGGLNIYVDGTLQATNASYSTPQNLGGYWRIGGDALGGFSGAGNFFSGALDDFVIYNHELTAAEAVVNDLNQYTFQAGYCANNSITLAAPVIAGATYSWVDNANAANTSSANPATFSSATTSSYSLTVTTSSCTNVSTVTPITPTYTWTGAGGTTSETLAANWTNTSTGVANVAPSFGGTESLVIPTGVLPYPVLTSNRSIYSLTIGTGASLTLGTFTLNVGCNIINNNNTTNGIVSASASGALINWNGALLNQAYLGTNTTFPAKIDKMTLANTNASTGTVTISGGMVDIYNLLTLTSTKLIVSGTATVTLKSTASLTASISAVNSPSTVTGIFNAERFIPGGAGTRGYRLLSSPVSSQTVSSINMFDFIEPAKTTFISGPGGTNTVGVVNNNGFDGSPNNNSAVLVYKESDTDPISRNVIGSDYKGTASINEYIPMGNGVLFFFRGNRTLVQSATPTGGNSFVSPYPYPNSATLNFKGTLVTGNVVVNRPVFNATSPLNYYNVKGTAFAPSATLTVTGFSSTLSYTANSATRNGFNLVGNPYASTIDLEKILLTNMTGANPTIYTLNNVTGNGFGTYQLSGTGTGASSTNGTALNGASRYALSGEGFFVKAANASATVTFQEAAKTTYPAGASGTVTGSPTVFSIVQKNPAIRIKLVQDTTLYNETLLSFKDDGNNGFTNDDVAYLPAPSQVVFMYSTTPEGAPCVINNMGKLETVPPIKLYAEGGVTGIYQMKFSGMESIDSYYRIFLKDSFTKDSLEITANPNYTFNINKANAATFGANRFSLVVYHSIPGVYQLVKFTGEKPAQSAGVVLNWETKNESDVITFNVERSNDGGKTYANLGTVQSAGKGSYTFTDVAPSAATDNIYRLKQADLNDAVTYSTLVDIKIQDILGITVNSIIVYPNPTTGIINVNVSKPVMGQVQLQIVNSTGKIVKKSIFDASQHFQENVSELLYGTYIINLFETASGKKVATAKFIKR